MVKITGGQGRFSSSLAGSMWVRRKATLTNKAGSRILRKKPSGATFCILCRERSTICQRLSCDFFC